MKPKYRCEECKHDFPTKYKIKRHLSSVHNISKDALAEVELLKPKYQIKCHVCEESVHSKEHLINHLNSAHSFKIALETAVFGTQEGSLTLFNSLSFIYLFCR